MLAIKLQRRGKKHQPTYRLVVQEKRSKLDGDFIDDLGSFNPKNKEASIKGDKVNYWLSVGAQATPSAHNLLITKGVIKGEKIAVHKHVVKKEPSKLLSDEKLGGQAETVSAIAEVKEIAKTDVVEEIPTAQENNL